MAVTGVERAVVDADRVEHLRRWLVTFGEVAALTGVKHSLGHHVCPRIDQLADEPADVAQTAKTAHAQHLTSVEMSHRPELAELPAKLAMCCGGDRLRLGRRSFQHDMSSEHHSDGHQKYQNPHQHQTKGLDTNLPGRLWLADS